MSYYYTDSDSDDDYPHCYECDRSFVNARALSQHNDAVHSTCFPCPRGNCSRVLASARALSQHENAVHPHHCDTCSRDFSSSNALDQHSQVHRPRSTQCPGCGKSYRGWTDTVLHIETGHCNGCKGRAAARRTVYDVLERGGGQRNLTRPLAITDGGVYGGGYDSDADDNYVCQACGKTFAALGSLMQHTDARPACRNAAPGRPMISF